MNRRSAKCVKCGAVVNDGAAAMRVAASSPGKLSEALTCRRCSGQAPRDAPDGRGASVRRAAFITGR